MEVWVCRATYSRPWHYAEVSCQLHALTALVPVEEPLVPIEYEPVYAPELLWTTWRGGKSCSYLT
jgi:hypothetical protein